MLRHASVLKLSKRMQNAAVALLFLFAYTISIVGPFVPIAHAAGIITFGAQFQNEKFPPGSNQWATGQLSGYSELDWIKFRFQMSTASQNAAGSMFIDYDTGSCQFFTPEFDLLTTNSGALSITKGANTPLYDNQNNIKSYRQFLSVTFTGATTNTAYDAFFKLHLSSTAGDCSGSNTGVRLGVPTTNNGDFDSVGAKNLPLSANDVLSNPDLTIKKVVVGGTAVASDFYFTTDVALSGDVNGISVTDKTSFNIPTTASQTGQVTIAGVNPDGTINITEHPVNGTTANQYTLDYAATVLANTNTGCSVVDAGGGQYTLRAAVVASTNTPTNATCTFVNKQKVGSITIVKDATPNGSQAFGFTATGVTETSFSLTDDGTTANTKVFSGLQADQTYTFTESGVTNWNLKNIICTGSQSSVIDTTTLPTVSVKLAAGENVTCTFSNDKQGTLVIEKQTLPDGSTAGFGFTDSQQGTTTLKDGENKSYQIVAGSTFSVDEDTKDGWQLTNLTCDNNSVTTDLVTGKVTFTPTAGETAKCVFTNTKLGSIKITKDAVPDSADIFSFTASGASVENFNLDGDSDVTVPNSKTFNGLLPGDFTFTEQTKDGWDFDSITCSGASVTKDGTKVIVHLKAGETAECTYKNRMHGKLIVHKTTLPSGSQQTFAVTASSSDGGLLPSGNTGTVSDANDATFTIQQNKKYSVAETLPDGWVETSNSCVNKVINGDSTLVGGVPTVECTIVNTQKATVTIVKQANPEGNTSFGFTGDFSSFNLVDDGTASNTKTFTNVLPNADYTVTESPISGWYLSNLSCTGGSYKQGVSASSVVVTPKPGESIICTFSNTKYGSISGTKYEVNGNGGLVAPSNLGWTIFLDANGNGLFDDGEQSTTTDANGNYTFNNLVAGVYRVYEVLKSGWTQIFGDSTVTLGVGEGMTRLDFGNFKDVSISGHKWDDTNGDGKWQDGTEKGLGGWTIFIDANGNSELDNGERKTTTTEFDGSYSFTNFSPGTYTLCEVMQAGWLATSPSSGCQDVTVSHSGVNKTDVDFGNFKKAGISGYKFNDHNGDGTKDSGDEKLGGWTIQLKDAAGSVIATTTTDGAGYSFTGLTPGTYKVCEVQQTNWAQTYPSGDGCHSLTVASGQTYTANFGNQGRGSLTVVKDVDDGFGKVTQDVSTWKWSYTGIKSDSNLATGSSNDQGVPAGVYDVEEDLASQANYHFTSVSCTGAGNDAVTNAAKTSVQVGVGENVVCTFTNTRDTANITVTKKVTSDNGGTAKVSDFELFVNQTKITSGSTNSYLTDTEYTISENPLVSGYEQTSLTCWLTSDPLKIDLGKTFTLSYGKDVSCEIVNDDIAPKLIVYKFVGNGYTNLTKASQDFTMYVDGTNVSEPSFPGDGYGTTVTLDAGSYKVTEGEHDGYNVETWGACDSTIAVGETKKCWFHNIAIEKPAINVVKTGPTQAHEGDVVTYTFTVTNPGNVPFPAVYVEDDIAGAGSYVSGDGNNNGYLDPGETWVYTAEYTIPEGQVEDVHNTVVACGSYGYSEEELSFAREGEGYKTVCDDDEHTLDVLHPGIHVVKTGPANVQLGTVGTYTFTVTNTGDTPLAMTKVLDDIAGVGVYQSGDTNDNDLLDLDENWVFTANYQYTTVGMVTNTVEVCGVDELEGEVCSEDQHDTIVYVPQVLGEETLVDTGARPWASTVIATALIMAGGMTLLLGRRNATYLSKK